MASYTGHHRSVARRESSPPQLVAAGEADRTGPHTHPTVSEVVMDASQQGCGLAPYLS
jgi:hypothetical protein